MTYDSATATYNSKEYDVSVVLPSDACYDSVNVASYPANTKIAMAYVDGRYANYPQVKARFPQAVVGGITTTVSGSMSALAYDCEKGDGNAVQAASWALRKLEAGQRPTIYCSRIGAAGYGWPWVQGALKNLKISLSAVDFWIADATGKAHLLAGSVATQWGQGGNGAYDISLTNGVWPGSTSPPAPLPTSPTTEEQMQAIIVNGVVVVYAANPTNNHLLEFTKVNPSAENANTWSVIDVTALVGNVDAGQPFLVSG